MGKLFGWLERIAGGGPGGEKRINSIRWLLLLGLIGAALMIMNNFSVKQNYPSGDSRASPGQQVNPATTSTDGDENKFADYERKYESVLKQMLEKIVGVGEVDVMVNVDSTEEIIPERNSQNSQQTTDERDQNGANRHVTNVTRSGDVVLYEQSGSQAPMVKKTIKPKIRGVLVVAKGAENVTVKKLITEAVERALDVPSYKISVAPRKQ